MVLQYVRVGGKMSAVSVFRLPEIRNGKRGKRWAGLQTRRVSGCLKLLQQPCGGLLRFSAGEGAGRAALAENTSWLARGGFADKRRSLAGSIVYRAWFCLSGCLFPAAGCRILTQPVFRYFQNKRFSTSPVRKSTNRWLVARLSNPPRSAIQRPVFRNVSSGSSAGGSSSRS